MSKNRVQIDNQIFQRIKPKDCHQAKLLSNNAHKKLPFNTFKFPEYVWANHDEKFASVLGFPYKGKGSSTINGYYVCSILYHISDKEGQNPVGFVSFSYLGSHRESWAPGSIKINFPTTFAHVYGKLFYGAELQPDSLIPSAPRSHIHRTGSTNWEHPKTVAHTKLGLELESANKLIWRL